MILTFFDKLFTIVMRYICIVTLTHNCKLSFMVISRVEKKKYWKFSNIRIFGCWLFWPLRWQAKNRLTCARLQFDSVGSVFFFFFADPFGCAHWYVCLLLRPSLRWFISRIEWHLVIGHVLVDCPRLCTIYAIVIPARQTWAQRIIQHTHTHWRS